MLLGSNLLEDPGSNFNESLFPLLRPRNDVAAVYDWIEVFGWGTAWGGGGVAAAGV